MNLHGANRTYKGARRPAHLDAAGWAGTVGWQEDSLSQDSDSESPEVESEAAAPRLIHDAYYCAVTNLTLRLI